MRKTTRVRLLFFSTAIAGYSLGSWLMPETIGNVTSFSLLYKQLMVLDRTAICLVVSTLLFFLVIPLAYWFWIIKATGRAKWRLIIILSLSSLVARYQYPAEIALYFEFIAWLRYPIIAVLLALEFYLIFSVGRSMWQARRVSGDPRLSILNKYEEGTKERDIGLPMAYETASWFYAIPPFSRQHIPSIGHLKLLSSNKMHFTCVLTIDIALGCISYFLLLDWSTLGAFVLSSLFIWNTLPIVANYRCSKHHSIYIENCNLVINNSWLGLIVVDLKSINSCIALSKGTRYEGLSLGRGVPNMKIQFLEKQTYYSFFGMLSDKASEVSLCVDNVEDIIEKIEMAYRETEVK